MLLFIFIWPPAAPPPAVPAEIMLGPFRVTGPLRVITQPLALAMIVLPLDAEGSPIVTGPLKMAVPPSTFNAALPLVSVEMPFPMNVKLLAQVLVVPLLSPHHHM